MSDPIVLINAALAMPQTHKVVTKFDDGSERVHTTRSLKTAENFAIGDKRNISRPLLRRDTGKTVHIVSVTISVI